MEHTDKRARGPAPAPGAMEHTDKRVRGPAPAPGAERFRAARAGIIRVAAEMRDEYAIHALRAREPWLQLEFCTAFRTRTAMLGDIGPIIRDLVEDGAAHGFMYARDVWALDTIGVERPDELRGVQVKMLERGEVGADIIMKVAGGASFLEGRLRGMLDMPQIRVRCEIVADAHITAGPHRGEMPITRVSLAENLAEARAAVAAYGARLEEIPEPPPPALGEARGLREWQCDAAAWATGELDARVRPLALSAAGGLGKTVAGAHIAHARAGADAVVLWVTPHRPLVRDAADELRRCGRDVYVLGDDNPEPRRVPGAGAPSGAPRALVVVAASAALKAGVVRAFIGAAPCFVVVDEAHRLVGGADAGEPSGAVTRRGAVDALVRGAALGALCMSATPRGMGIADADTFHLPYSYGVDNGMLVPYRVTAALMTRNDGSAWAEHLADNRTLLPAMIICDGLESIGEQVRACQAVGLFADTVNSTRCSRAHRADVQDRLRDPRRAFADPLEVIVVHRCCIEGVDYPLLRTTAFRHMFGSADDVLQAVLRSSRAVAGTAKTAAHIMVPFVTGPVAAGVSREELAAGVDAANHAGLARLCAALVDHERRGSGDDEAAARARVAARCELDARTHARAAARGCPERSGVLRAVDEASGPELEPGRALGTVLVDTMRRAVDGTSLAELAQRDAAAAMAEGRARRARTRALHAVAMAEALARRKLAQRDAAAAMAEALARRAMGGECAARIINGINGKHRAQYLLRALADDGGELAEAAARLVAGIDDWRARNPGRRARRRTEVAARDAAAMDDWRARRAQAFFALPAETAEALARRAMGGGPWRKYAFDVGNEASTAFRAGGDAPALVLAVQRAAAAHVARYGVPTGTGEPTCAATILNSLRNGGSAPIREALRALAGAGGELAEAAAALVAEIDEARGLAAI